MIPRNQIIHTDNVAGLRSLPDECIPLTVTSPPWDGMRIYSDIPTAWNMEVFRVLANELWRVLLPGGVVCWHVADQISDGSESGTSAEQKIYFRDIGFRIWQTLVIETVAGHMHKHRYGASIQYVFVLSKGKPRCVNLLRDKPNKHAGDVKRFTKRDKRGNFFSTTLNVIADFGVRGPVWRYYPRQQRDDEARLHPAPMDETICRDLIYSFSKPGDLVVDPFSGVGTTAKWAMLQGRYFLGYEAEDRFCQLSKTRLERYRVKLPS